ncbi:MBL fold metallo-hydrolase [Catenulispora sp. NL8]|uniref:MBL fold metallo-hydrolase n=1 Tax=Catenulispora pinistramenti TaxID=2705254 RepID=A0ABS5L6G1_9ACTN|nr:MBL fold metallo-hydrolase [Catenulispora pinistramenti]
MRSPLDLRWNHGVRRGSSASEPPIQVHAYDDRTVILRQSKSTNFEAPFIYLLFGADRAILLDTGATADPAVFPLRQTVDGLIADWLKHHPRDGYELVVAHTHGHGDHVAADGQFADRPNTTVVARDPEAVRAFFGFDDARWPDQEVPFDLGGRALTAIGAPGHHAAGVVFHDPTTGFLLTGDTVYPGRIYVADFTELVATLNRLVAFTTAHEVTWVMGCHIEMTDRPYRDYPIGSTYQPHERPLPMTVAQLTALRDAAVRLEGRRGAHRFADFIVFYEPAGLAKMLFLARGYRARVFGR